MLYPCTGVWVDAQKGIPGAILNSKRRELFGPKSPVCEHFGERAGSVNPARNSLLGSERPVPSQQAAWSRVDRSKTAQSALGLAVRVVRSKRWLGWEDMPRSPICSFSRNCGSPGRTMLTITMGRSGCVPSSSVGVIILADMASAGAIPAIFDGQPVYREWPDFYF